MIISFIPPLMWNHQEVIQRRKQISTESWTMKAAITWDTEWSNKSGFPESKRMQTLSSTNVWSAPKAAVLRLLQIYYSFQKSAKSVIFTEPLPSYQKSTTKMLMKSPKVKAEPNPKG